MFDGVNLQAVATLLCPIVVDSPARLPVNEGREFKTCITKIMYNYDVTPNSSGEAIIIINPYGIFGAADDSVEPPATFDSGPVTYESFMLVYNGDGIDVNTGLGPNDSYIPPTKYAGPAA